MEIQSIIKLINFLENKIPQSLRLGQTFFFTQLVIVEDRVQYQNEMVSHLNEDDIISCIITLGEPCYSGEIYYNSVTQVTSRDIEIKIHFQHCRLQIGSLNKISHGVSPWVRSRLTLNFNLKKNVDHFKLFGHKYYSQHEKDGFWKYSLY